MPAPTRSARAARKALAALVAALALLAPTLASPGSASPSPTAAAERAEARGGTLKVRVVKPGGGRKAGVVVRGPQGYRKVLRRTTRLKGLVPGRYRVRAATVRTKKWYARPEITKRTVRVRARRVARTEVSYFNTISTRTRVLKGSQIRDYTAPDDFDSRGSIVLASEAPVGSILASGVTRETPYGALLKVLAVRRTSAGWVHEVRLAGLDEAVMRAEFDTTVVASSPGVERRLPGAARDGVARRGATAAGCAGSMKAGATLDGSAKLQAAFSGSIGKWYAPNPQVRLDVTADARITANAWAEAAGSCTTGEITLFSTVPTIITFMIGPIPVVLVPKIDITAGAAISANGKLSITAGVRAKADGHLVVKLFGSPETGGSGPTFEGVSFFDVAASAEADAHATGRMSLLLYGIVGPYAQARVGVTGKADSAADPWWTIDAYGQAGAGVRIGNLCVRFLGCTKLEAGNDKLVDKTVRLAQAGGPYPPEAETENALEGTGVQITRTTIPPLDAFGIGPFLAPGDNFTMTTGDRIHLPGRPDELSSVNRHDTAVGQFEDVVSTSFTVVPEHDHLRIPWVFGTEEPVGSGNDTAEIKVDGTNCALIGGGPVNAAAATVANTGQLSSRFDRTTPVQVCDLEVVPRVPVKVELWVGDSYGGEHDSALAIVGDHITSYDGP